MVLTDTPAASGIWASGTVSKPGPSNSCVAMFEIASRVAAFLRSRSEPSTRASLQRLNLLARCPAMPLPDNAIEARGLVKRYGAKTALAGVDLDVPRGSVCGLLGPNGAGKTTAVRVLTTLTAPDAGTATVAGHDVLADPVSVRRSIGLAAQDATVDGLLTGRENLVMIGELHHLGRKRAKQRAQELLAQFSLSDAADKMAKEYSGGMRRRLDLAVTLVSE